MTSEHIIIIATFDRADFTEISPEEYILHLMENVSQDSHEKGYPIGLECKTLKTCKRCGAVNDTVTLTETEEGEIPLCDYCHAKHAESV